MEKIGTTATIHSTTTIVEVVEVVTIEEIEVDAVNVDKDAVSVSTVGHTVYVHTVEENAMLQQIDIKLMRHLKIVWEEIIFDAIDNVG